MKQTLARLHHYTLLVLFRSWADFRRESTRMWLGCVWWVLEPLIYMVVYFVAFGIILQRGRPGFLPFLIIGIVAYRFFSATLLASSNAIYSSMNIVQQFRIPKVIFPLITFMRNLYHFVFSLLLLFTVLMMRGNFPNTHWLGYIPSLVTLLLLTLGLGLSLGAIVPFLPDIHRFMSHVIHFGLFLSGIFWDPATKSDVIRPILYLNPLCVIITSMRASLIDGKMPMWRELSAISSIGLLLIILGFHLIDRFDGVYAKRVPK